MNFFYLVLPLLNVIKISGRELSLEVFKTIDGIEIPVSEPVEERAGVNISLICKLVVSSEVDEESYYFGDEVSWSRNLRHIQFNTVPDLDKLAPDPQELLPPYRVESKLNKAVLKFRPLYMEDAGEYFCMSVKYKLLKIVEIDVNVAAEPTGFMKYFSSVDKPRLDFKFINDNGPLTFPRFLCTEDMFTCKSGASCIDYQYVCDNVKDCLDGSDETYFCGIHPCAHKKKCSNGRCISKELCCDKFKDPNCYVNIPPACCFENEDGKVVPPHMPSDLDLSNNFNIKYDLIPDYDDDDQDYHNSNEASSLRSETIWVVVPCTLILVLFIICVALRQVRSSKRNRSIRNVSHPRQSSHVSGSTQTTSVSGSLHSNSTRVSSNPSRSVSRDFPPGYGAQNLSRYLDLPPSYDEVVRAGPPSAPPCNGLA